MASYFTSALMDMDSQLEVLESLQALAKNAEITESIQSLTKHKEINEEISANNLTSHISSSNAFDLKSSLGDYLNNVLQDSNEENCFSNVVYAIGSPSPISNSERVIVIIPENKDLTNKTSIRKEVPYSPLRLKSEICVGTDTDTNDISKSAQYTNNPTSTGKVKKWWCLC